MLTLALTLTLVGSQKLMRPSASPSPERRPRGRSSAVAPRVFTLQDAEEASQLLISRGTEGALVIRDLLDSL